MEEGRRIFVSGKIEPLPRQAIVQMDCKHEGCTKKSVYGMLHCFEHLPNCEVCGKLASIGSNYCIKHQA